MDAVNLFMLFPESDPSNQWMVSNAEHQSEDGINIYVYELNLLLQETDIEVFTGYYDKNNVDNFLKDFNDLEDYYPQPARRLFYSIIASFYDWRESTAQRPDNEYLIFQQKVTDHTFCEIGQRKRNTPVNKFLLICRNAHSLGKSYDILFNNETTKVESAQTPEEISEWFVINRIPERGFHAIAKHGENREDIRVIRNKVVSPLKSSAEEAKIFLKEAVGKHIDELFAYDHGRDNFIVYKFEGDNPQHKYHGYHVSRESNEVPNELKDKLLSRYGMKQKKE